MSTSYLASWHHFVFSTKDREPILPESFLPAVFDYIGKVLRNEGGILLSAGGMPDHLHLLGSIPREATIPDTMRLVKSKSSRWIRQNMPGSGGFSWQRGYGAFSVSPGDLERVRRYLRRQKEHHQAMTFQEEFVKFLESYDVPYDPRYIWK